MYYSGYDMQLFRYAESGKNSALATTAINEVFELIADEVEESMENGKTCDDWTTDEKEEWLATMAGYEIHSHEEKLEELF